MGVGQNRSKKGKQRVEGRRSDRRASAKEEGVIENEARTHRTCILVESLARA